jgi:hypothetical protein
MFLRWKVFDHNNSSPYFSFLLKYLGKGKKKWRQGNSQVMRRRRPRAVRWPILPLRETKKWCDALRWSWRRKWRAVVSRYAARTNTQHMVYISLDYFLFFYLFIFLSTYSGHCWMVTSRLSSSVACGFLHCFFSLNFFLARFRLFPAAATAHNFQRRWRKSAVNIQ